MDSGENSMIVVPFGNHTLLLGMLLFTALIATALAQPSQQTISDPSAEQAEMELLLRLAKQRRSVRKVDVMIDTAGHPFIGGENAKLVLIEFGDFQCLFCRRHHTLVMPVLLSEFVNKGHLQYVFQDFPIVDRHTDSFQAAVAARCAQDQHKYWEMRKRLYINATFLKHDDLMGHATKIGLDLPSFENCLNSDRHTDTIRRDQTTGLSLRVRGTPTFFLGLRNTETNQVQLMSSIIGAQPIELFRRELELIIKEDNFRAIER